MKPLNYKERDDKFWNFVIAGTVTIAMVVGCFYFTHDFLLDAVASNKVERYNRFLKHQIYQRQYVRQLDGINKSLSDGGFQINDLISQFKITCKKNGDTTSLMNKIAVLANQDASLSDKKNKTDIELSQSNWKLKNCNRLLAE